MVLRLILLIHILIVLNSNIVKSQNIVSNEISSITVFLNNAEITRVGNINIPKGKSEVIFRNISTKILNNGLKLSVNSGVKVYAIKIETDDDYLLTNEDYQLQLEESEKINEQIRINDSRLEVLKKEMLFLESNMKLAGNNVTFTQLDQGIQYFRDKIEDLQKRISSESDNRNDLLKELKKKTKNIKEVKEKLQQTNTLIKVVLISNSATKCNLKLKYLVSNALWKPNYSIRANEQNNTIDIEYQAQINNDTGNDWKDKPITLAILDSSDDINIPDLKIWTLEENNKEYSSSTRKRSRNYKKEKSDAKSDTEYDVIEIDDLSTRIELNDLHSIPSDANPHLIDISKHQNKVNYYTLSIPKVKDGAFKIAQILNWKSSGFLDGNADLYLNDTYQGSTELKTQQINDTLDIALGRNYNFNISRGKVSSRNKKRLIGFNITEIITYEILVKNNRNETIYW